jgi:hypothetical protein
VSTHSTLTQHTGVHELVQPALADRRLVLRIRPAVTSPRMRMSPAVTRPRNRMSPAVTNPRTRMSPAVTYPLDRGADGRRAVHVHEVRGPAVEAVEQMRAQHDRRAARRALAPQEPAEYPCEYPL